MLLYFCFIEAFSSCLTYLVAIAAVLKFREINFQSWEDWGVIHTNCSDIGDNRRHLSLAQGSSGSKGRVLSLSFLQQDGSTITSWCPGYFSSLIVVLVTQRLCSLFTYVCTILQSCGWQWGGFFWFFFCCCSCLVMFHVPYIQALWKPQVIKAPNATLSGSDYFLYIDDCVFIMSIMALS